MVITVLAALLVQQPQVAIAIDRDTVLAGDDVIVTITVQAPGDLPVNIVNPPLIGLEIRNTSNQSRYTVVGNVGSRTTTRTLTLRALEEGVAEIGAVVVRQGDREVATPSITVIVRGALPRGARALDPAVAALLLSMEPAVPSAEEVALTVSAVPDRVTLGGQVDVIIAAWVPRAIRSRLRNPPTLESPQVRGAWAYRRPTPPGIAMTREVGGITYDVFVQHEVIFPLSSESATIGAAKVSYSLPLSYSFLSREQHHEVQSEPVVVTVAPHPPPPPGIVFGGATGSDLEFTVEAFSRELAIGEASRVSAIVSGKGNVALWPEPDLHWPAGLRAYAQGVDVRLNGGGGAVGGEKVFNYLVVADSVGSHHVQVSAYTYFDVDALVYRELTAAPLEFMTPGSALMLANRGEGLPPLLDVPSQPSVDAIFARTSRGSLIGIVLLPPLLVLLVGLMRRPRRARPARMATDTTSLHGLDIAFRRLLESLVPHAAERSGEELADALRAAGIEATLAAHASRLRDRLSSAVYGPEDLADSDELSMEVREVVGALTAEHHPMESRAVALALFVCFAIPTVGWSQTPEELYRAGAARAAADSLAIRAETAKYVPEHWYNLGNAFSALGEPVHARAAWVRAARLAPRNQTIRNAVRGAVSGGITRRPATVWIAPLTAPEAFTIAVLFWIGAWALVIVRRRRRTWVPLLVAATLMAGAGLGIQRRYATPIALIVAQNTGLRAAPVGPSPLTVRLELGTPVEIEREEGQWMLVRIGPDRGWIRRSSLTRL